MRRKKQASEKKRKVSVKGLSCSSEASDNIVILSACPGNRQVYAGYSHHNTYIPQSFITKKISICFAFPVLFFLPVFFLFPAVTIRKNLFSRNHPILKS